VNVDDDGPRARELLRGPIEDAGDHQPVEALPRDYFCVRQRLRVGSAHLARRPSLEASAFHIDRVDIAERSRTREVDRKRSPGPVPGQIPDHAGRQRWHRKAPGGARVEKKEFACRASIGNDRQTAAHW
jgi:hypothetical protein